MIGTATIRTEERQPRETMLLRQFAAGDKEAFETLFRQHQAEVYGWIVRIVRDAGAAEDLTVETFWRIYRARERFDPERSFGAWARRIAGNAALDHLKSLRPEAPLTENLAVATEPDPAQRQDVRRKTEWAFRQLPVRLQAVASLALVEERPYQEIGELLGISVAAVKSRVFRAVRILRRELSKLGIKP